MTLSWLELASVLLLPLLAGMGLLRSLGLCFEDDRLAFGGWAYLVGSLATGMLVLVFLLAELPLEARFLAPCAGALALGGLGLAFRRRTEPRPPPAPRTPRGGAFEERLWIALLLVLTAITLLRMLEGSLHPIVEGDEGRIWARKARWLFRAGGFGPAFREIAGAFGTDAHLDYPLLNPLLQIWTFAHAGDVLHVENRFAIQFSGIALLWVLAGALRRRMRPGAAAVLVLLFFHAQYTGELARVMFSDGMLALGLLAAVDAWLRWRESGNPAWWRLAAIGCAFLVLSKYEGAFYLLAALAALGLAQLFPGDALPGPAPGSRRLAWRVRVFGLLPFVAFALTWTLNAHLGFRSDVANESALASLVADPLGRLARIGTFFLERAFVRVEQDEGFLAVFLVLVLACPRRALHGELRPLTLFLGLVLAGYVFIYLATPRELEWHLLTSADRLFYQSLPVVVLAVAHLGARVLPARLVGSGPEVQG